MKSRRRRAEETVDVGSCEAAELCPSNNTDNDNNNEKQIVCVYSFSVITVAFAVPPYYTHVDPCVCVWLDLFDAFTAVAE